MIVRVTPVTGGRTSLCLWCPGCENLHRVTIGAADSWAWDGDTERPTITPSVLVTGTQWAPDSGFHHPRHEVAAGELVGLPLLRARRSMAVPS